MHSAAVVKKEMFVFGGLDENHRAKSDMFSLDLESMLWKHLGAFRVDGEELRMCCHSATGFEDNKILVFGGLDPEKGTIYNQLFVYYPEGKQWGRVENTRSPRFCGSIVAFGKEIIITGGCNLVNRTVPATEKLSFEALAVDMLA